MQLVQIKNQVFTAIATTSTEAVKQWATQHGINADLRTKAGWQQVLEALACLCEARIARHAQPIAEKAIATTKSVAKAIHEADMVEVNEAICNEASAIARDLRTFWTPVIRAGWHGLRLAAIGFAIAAIYCLRAGQQTRAFIGEFEDTGLAPHQIAGHLLKPVMKWAYVQRDRLQVWGLNRIAEVKRYARLRRLRELVIQFVGAVAIASASGLVG